MPPQVCFGVRHQCPPQPVPGAFWFHRQQADVAALPVSGIRQHAADQRLVLEHPEKGC